MKRREGFVSNSSSSSFCIYGKSISVEEQNDLYDRSAEISDQICEMGLKLQVEFNPLGYEICIGRSYSNIADTETGKSFKESIEADIAKLFGEKQACSLCTSAWYDG